eukprot:GDKH01016509.1.p2 GENE.GDKH01016509.1~~GDKH01016509.1.p2  ORF type:complete len:151 (-),score=29.96 GDKH01016509.1:73-525(-)
MASRTIIIGSDHAGFQMKEALKSFVESLGIGAVKDMGAHSEERCDYPDFARTVCKEVLATENAAGILVCGSGIGISIAANKVDGIRCALCHDHYTAKMSRLHNDANCIAIGGRVVGLDVAKDMVQVFLSTAFEGGRHADRVKKIHECESC